MKNDRQFDDKETRFPSACRESNLLGRISLAMTRFLTTAACDENNSAYDEESHRAWYIRCILASRVAAFEMIVIDSRQMKVESVTRSLVFASPARRRSFPRLLHLSWDSRVFPCNGKCNGNAHPRLPRIKCKANGLSARSLRRRFLVYGGTPLRHLSLAMSYCR